MAGIGLAKPIDGVRQLSERSRNSLSWLSEKVGAALDLRVFTGFAFVMGALAMLTGEPVGVLAWIDTHWLPAWIYAYLMGLCGAFIIYKPRARFYRLWVCAFLFYVTASFLYLPGAGFNRVPSIIYLAYFIQAFFAK